MSENHSSSIANYSDEDILNVFNAVSTIAVVGASSNPNKAAHRIPAMLQEAGFTVIPVNPREETLLGVKAYPDLASIPESVDLVNVFRPADEAPGIAEQAASIGSKYLWLQLGIVSEEAKGIAQDNGLTFIQDLCIGATASRLGFKK